MTNDYEIWKCITLIRMLKKRKQSTERAMEIYSKSIYKKSLKIFEESKQSKINDYESKV